MAFSPCPKCQDKRTFDKLNVQDAAFVIVKSPYAAEFWRNDYVCTRNPEHKWYDYSAIRSALKQAGYLR